MFRIGFVDAYNDGSKQGARLVMWSEDDPLRVESSVSAPDDGTLCIAGTVFRVTPVASATRAVRALVPVAAPAVAPAGATDTLLYPAGSARMLGVAKVVISHLADGRAELLVDRTAQGPSVAVTAKEGGTLTLGEHKLTITAVRAGRGVAMGHLAWRTPAS